MTIQYTHTHVCCCRKLMWFSFIAQNICIEGEIGLAVVSGAVEILGKILTSSYDGTVIPVFSPRHGHGFLSIKAISHEGTSSAVIRLCPLVSQDTKRIDSPIDILDVNQFKIPGFRMVDL